MAASHSTSDLCGAGSRIAATGLFELHETEFEFWNDHDLDDWEASQTSFCLFCS